MNSFVLDMKCRGTPGLDASMIKTRGAQ